MKPKVYSSTYMKNEMCLPTSAKNYQAPREHPLEYPGHRPKTGFILAEEKVYPIVWDDKDRGTTSKGQVILNENKPNSINRFLDSYHVAPLEKRFAVIGYGSNIVPGQLVSKFGKNTVVPVILGKIKGYDVVYNLISNMGYAFAEMYKNKSVEGNIGITFLDKKQFTEMVETEQNYKLAYSPSDVELESGETVKGSKIYIFAGYRKMWVPENYETPIPIAELPANGRAEKPLTQTETLELVIEQFNLKEKGIYTPEDIVNTIRKQSNWEEKSGKLKYELQCDVEQNSRSLPAFESQVTLVNENLKLGAE